MQYVGRKTENTIACAFRRSIFHEMNFKSIKGKSRFFILIKLIIAVQTHAENASTAEQKKHYKKIDLSR